MSLVEFTLKMCCGYALCTN